LKYKRYVVFDTETTGLQPDECQIIEFAALVLDENAKVIAEIDQFIKAESIPAKITELTGITKANTDDGIEESDLVTLINKINKVPTLWIAHNAQFDLSFVRSTYARCNGDFDEAFKDCDFLDTLTVYRDRADKPHKLANAIDHYKCEDVENSHRAIDDVKALWAVVKAITKERNDLGIYVNVFGGNTSTPISRVKYKYQKYGFKERGQRLPEL
jgi:DNA polymerase III alpha subunit (gram-positive type)